MSNIIYNVLYICQIISGKYVQLKYEHSNVCNARMSNSTGKLGVCP